MSKLVYVFGAFSCDSVLTMFLVMGTMVVSRIVVSHEPIIAL